MLLKMVIFLLPWYFRRKALNKFFGFKIHRDAYIGFSWIFPRNLIMEAGARINHFNVAINLDLIQMGIKSTIGRGNWITGFSTYTSSRHFSHQATRSAVLQLGDSSAITKNHHIDCTNKIEIGRFSTIAGYRSQLLTHSFDLMENRQDSLPIFIGEYTFIGTNVVILGGSSLPSKSVLGAKSLLNKPYLQEWTLYAGVPAKPIQEISKNGKYFSRIDGFVY